MTEQLPDTTEFDPPTKLLTFNSKTRTWEPFEIPTFNLPEGTSGKPWPEGNRIFVYVSIYDIPRTTERALRQLSRRYTEESYCLVFNSVPKLEIAVLANTGVKLIADARIPPSEVPDQEAWKKIFAADALEVGCDGVLVDFDPIELAIDYPDKLFFTGLVEQYE